MAVRITGAGVALTVGIIVVTGLIIGGLFFARQAGDQARRDEATKIAEQNQEQKEGGDVALNEGENTTESGTESNNSSEGTNEGSTSGNGSTETPEASESQNIPTTGPSSNESVQSVEELPRTGGGDIFANVAAVGGLTFAIATYVASRKALQGVR